MKLKEHIDFANLSKRVLFRIATDLDLEMSDRFKAVRELRRRRGGGNVSGKN